MTIEQINHTNQQQDEPAREVDSLPDYRDVSGKMLEELRQAELRARIFELTGVLPEKAYTDEQQDDAA